MAAASNPLEAVPSPTDTTEIPSLERVASAFPQLEILELIGRGGMGFVFKARQPHLERFVALKLLPDKLARDPRFAERFHREGRMLARLNHPNVVSIYDFGVTDHFCFLLMELVDGVNLRQAMQAGRLSPEKALSIVPRICDALQYAHGRGVLHRDIKPENILLDLQGHVKIADFGIAKLVGDDKPDVALTATGAALGTMHYMAPEQFEKPAEIDHRADIYSLGVVFYEMLTGELPIGRFAPPSSKTPVGKDVDEVVFRTLERDRERRFQSAGELKTEIELLAPGNAAAQRSPNPRSQAKYGPSGTLVVQREGVSPTDPHSSQQTVRDAAPAIPRRRSLSHWLFAAGLGLVAVLVFRSVYKPDLPQASRSAPATDHPAPASVTEPTAIRANFRVAKGQVVTFELLRYIDNAPVPVSSFAGCMVARDDERARFSLLLSPTNSSSDQTSLPAWTLILATEEGARIQSGVAAFGHLIPRLPPDHFHSIEPDSTLEILLTQPHPGTETNGLTPHPLLSLNLTSRARDGIGGHQQFTTISMGSTNWAKAIQRERVTGNVPQPEPGEVLANQWLKSPAATGSTNTIQFTFTAVELRSAEGSQWLAIDYATHIQGDCEEVFHLDGENFASRKSGVLIVPEHAPPILRQRFELRIPQKINQSTVTKLRDEFARALVGKSFLIPAGEQRPLLRLPVGTEDEVRLAIGTRLRDPR